MLPTKPSCPAFAGRPTSPENLDAVWDLLTGNDNRGDGGISVENEPGNQLGGVDLRWALGPSFAFYSQSVGEDAAGGTPSHYMHLGGVEIWAGRPGGSSYRFRLEYADTRAKFFNSAYNHSIYTDGYRYRGRILGHAMGNHGRMVSLAVVLARRTVPRGSCWPARPGSTGMGRVRTCSPARRRR